MVTVSAPNAPCMHTHTSVNVGNQGLTSRLWRRSHQVMAAKVRIKTPTPVAK